MQPESNNQSVDTNTPNQPTNSNEVPTTPSSSPSSSKGSRFAGLKSLKGNKPALIIVAAIILLGVGSAGAYFNYVVPNNPDKLWKKSLDNSAKGYDNLVKYADSQKDVKGGKLKGTFKFDSKDAVVDGNIDVKYYDKNSSSKIDAGVAGTRFNLELLTNVPENAKNPDIYAKISGLKGLDSVLGASAAGVGQAFEQYDNQWYVVDHTLLDQAEKSAADSATNATEITSKDITDFANAIGVPTKEYVFTDDQSKAVFTVKEKVGKEKLDNRNTYHYKVGISKEHLKAYNNAVCDKIAGTKLFKTLSFGQSEEEAKKECKDTKDIDKIDESKTADAWVDMKTKLIRKVQFDDPKIKGDFVAIALNYNGGDEYPFAITMNASEGEPKGKGTLAVTLNTKKNTSNIKVNFEGTDNKEAIKFTLDATAEPSSEKVEFKKPDGAKSLLEAFGGLLGAGGLGGASPVGSGAAAGGADAALYTQCSAAFQAYATSGTPLPANCEALINQQ